MVGNGKNYVSLVESNFAVLFETVLKFGFNLPVLPAPCVSQREKIAENIFGELCKLQIVPTFKLWMVGPGIVIGPLVAYV